MDVAIEERPDAKLVVVVAVLFHRLLFLPEQSADVGVGVGVEDGRLGESLLPRLPFLVVFVVSHCLRLFVVVVFVIVVVVVAGLVFVLSRHLDR